MPLLFPLGEYWWLYAGFVGAVLVLLALDLGILHREARPVRFREAVAWCATWVALALLFNVALYAYGLWKFPQDPRLTAVPGFDPREAAWQVALEFLTGYLVEYSLSVDNIFVFVLVLRYFGVPARYQYRVLFYGILGALVFRALFVALGSLLMQFHWIVWLFGVFLVFTGIKMAVTSEAAVEPGRNILTRLLRRLLPVTPQFHGQHFFVRQGGRLWATPLAVALLCLEATDIVFAIDSVPAIFAITREPFVVFTSNILAILGLRSLYFMLGGAVERFHLLRYGLATVLVFVGVKMVWLDEWFGGKFPIGVSLAIIGSVLVLSVVLSLFYPPRRTETGARARAGKVRTPPSSSG
ncbi:MAG: TerC/Alx family metal homeostasis membrane protein [Candidatus Rokuibacteriota bacterium]